MQVTGECLHLRTDRLEARRRATRARDQHEIHIGTQGQGSDGLPQQPLGPVALDRAADTPGSDDGDAGAVSSTR